MPATVAAPVVKKVPSAPQPAADAIDETEVDLADDVAPSSGLDKMLASVAVVMALLSTLTSFWAYAALK